MSSYINLMAAHNLLITEMVEPAPPPGFIAQAEEYRDAALIPRLLFLMMQKISY